MVVLKVGEKERKITRFLFEAGELKREKRTGWWHAGIKDPESVAEHSMRAALVALLLAKMEGHPHPEKLAVMALVHDLPEAQLGDQHKIAARYNGDRKKQEKTVAEEQLASLPGDFKYFIRGFVVVEDEKARVILRDADLLENALQAKEYCDVGFKEAVHWLERIEEALQTKSAKELVKEIKKQNAFGWWHGLKLPVK